MDAVIPYRVIIDRISHCIEFYRPYLKKAALSGCYVVNSPFWFPIDDKFLNAEIAKKLGVTRQAVNGVIMGRYRSATIEQALVEAGIPKFLLDEEDSDQKKE